MQFKTVHTNGINLHVVQAGRADGPLVILLHGFPEYWRAWQAYIDPLVAAGYRVWVPDQRGYNLSDKPRGFKAYSLRSLGKDIVGLINAAGVDKAFVIGHDWGASVAWWLAHAHPSRIERMVAINVPHRPIIERNIWFNWRQTLKSWYIFFFQLPRLPEWLLRQRNFLALELAMSKSSRPGVFDEDDFHHYRQAWGQPNAIRSMLSWYRAAARVKLPKLADERVRVPTLLLWGKQDNFLSHSMAQQSIDCCNDGQLVLFDEATHWLPHEEAVAVLDAILKFLALGAR